MANINPQVVIYQVIYQVEVSDETSSTTAAVAETSLTFSFCCDLATLSFLCSLFNLSSSSSCCRAAIAASSLATSSCRALHCCSYTHAHANARQRVGGEKTKQSYWPSPAVPKELLDVRRPAGHRHCGGARGVRAAFQTLVIVRPIRILGILKETLLT